MFQVLTAVKKGDFSVRLPAGSTSINGKIADTLNDILDLLADSARRWTELVAWSERKED